MEEILHPLFRWIHIIAGITWIGLLYFFNFINGHVAATMDADSKRKVVPELMPRALYWFRYGAAWTWLSGVVLMYIVFGVVAYHLENQLDQIFLMKAQWSHKLLILCYYLLLQQFSCMITYIKQV